MVALAAVLGSAALAPSDTRAAAERAPWQGAQAGAPGNPATADPNAAVTTRIRADLARLEIEMQVALFDQRFTPVPDIEIVGGPLNPIRTAPRNNADTSADTQRPFPEILQEYREVLIADLFNRTAGANAGYEIEAGIDDFLRDHRARWKTALDTSFDYLVNQIQTAETPEAEAQAYSNIEAAMRASRAAEDIAREAKRRLGYPMLAAEPRGPFAQSVDDPLPVDRHAENKVTADLRRLIERITGEYVEDPLRFAHEDSDARETMRTVERWRLGIERELDIEEFMTLADSGVLVFEGTEQVISGDLRIRIGKDIKLQLVEALEASAIEPNVIRTALGWADSRNGLAATIEAQVGNNDRYRALDLITPGMSDAPMSSVFNAMAHVVQTNVQVVVDSRAQIIPEGGEGGFSGWLYETFVAEQQTGLEVGWSIRSGEIDQVDYYIGRLQSEGDVVVSAFRAAAATPEPRDLPADQHDLLSTFGYIGVSGDGTEYYRMPRRGSATPQLRAGVEMPGSSLLDAISGENAIAVVTLAAVPEIAGAKVAFLLRGYELGAGVVLAEFGTTTVVAGALAAADQRFRLKQPVEWDRLIIETAILGPLSAGIGSAGSLATEELATLLKNPRARAAAAAFVSETFQLSSEAALDTWWQARSTGTDMTFEQFLASAANSAMARGGEIAGATVGDVLRPRPRPLNVPGFLQQAAQRQTAEGDPALLLELGQNFSRVSALQGNFEASSRRFADIVGDDAMTLGLLDPVVISRLNTGLENGGVLWTDVKTVLGSTYPRMEAQVLSSVNVRRWEFVDFILGAARHRARRVVLAEGKRRGWSEDRIQRELGNIDAQAIIPGSRNGASDVDRSVESPYLLNELKKLTNEILRDAGGDPVTSALAYDVNEYINAMSIINRQNASGVSLAAVPTDDFGLTHAQAVEANAFAFAMMHMSPRDRSIFRDTMNAREAGDRTILAQQFDYAESSLARGRRDLEGALANLGVDPSAAGASAIMRAKETLYGERTLELNEMEARLEQLTPGSDEYNALAARIERGWNYALREGIEAYADFTTLDIIVNEIQIAGNSVRWALSGEGRPFLARMMERYGDSQFSALVYNQVGMAVEHMHAFHLGDESPVQAGSALGKYAERALLGLALQGADVNSGALGELNDIVGAMVVARKDTTMLEKVLRDYGGGDAAAGLLEVAGLFEQAVPGLNGLLTTVDPALLVAHGQTGAAGALGTVGEPVSPLARRLAELARSGDEGRDAADLLLGAGVMALLAAREAHIDDLEREAEQIDTGVARDRRLRKLYHRKDWPLVLQLEDEREANWHTIQALPVDSKDGTMGRLLENDRRIAARLDDMSHDYNAAGGPSTFQPSDEDRRRAARRRAIDQDLDVARRNRDETAALVVAYADQAADMGEPSDGAAAVIGELVVASGGTAVPPPTPDTPEQQARDAGVVLLDPGTEEDTTAPPAEDTSTEPPGEDADAITLHVDLDDLTSLNPPEAVGDADEKVQYMILEVVFGADGTITVRPLGREGAPPTAMLTQGAGTTARLPPRLALGVWIGGALGFPTPSGAISTSATQAEGPVQIFLTNLGTSTGEAFATRIINRSDRPVRFSGEALVVEPLGDAAQRAVRRQLTRLGTEIGFTANLDAYCLELLKSPPPAGTEFRIASREIQEHHKPARDILAASRRIHRLSGLHPDSDPDDYYHSIRQWALWTHEQGFDREDFGEAFLAHTRKNLEAGGQAWSEEIAEVLMGAVPNRWQDIARILAEAGLR